MQRTLSPIMRDYLIRFQQTAIRETGRRALTYRRTPMDEQLVLPGCQRPGYVFWQPIPWKDDKVPLGKNAKQFHPSIVEYLSMCQFMEMRFRLPVAPMNSPLSFLHGRVFECYRNTVSAPPSRAFDEALLYHEQHPDEPLAFCMAATCDGGSPIRMLLAAQDGQMYVQRAQGDMSPVFCRLTVERLLPKLQFEYEF
jgi:hypothetical protein